MSSVSKSLSQPAAPRLALVSAARKRPPDQATRRSLWFQIAAVYILLETALWTPQGVLGIFWAVLTTVVITVLAFRGRYSALEMGLARPTLAGSLWILGIGVVLAGVIPAIAALAHANTGPTHILPLRNAWQYALWACEQQFILQSFFYVRMETLLGSRKAVLATAVLFAFVHIPSPVLTLATLVAGVFFCEMFRRCRNIFSLGVVHAMLGLTLAASFSDSLLRHMRVGVGYLMFHP